MKYGITNAKGGKIVANNGTYFVDLTNATESSGVYTIPSEDIENGDFTLQVGDTLIDKDSGSMLKIATLTPSITASLVFEASSGGGKQLYQHILHFKYIPDSGETGNSFDISVSIINDKPNAMNYTSLKEFLDNNNIYDSSYNPARIYPASGSVNKNNSGEWYPIIGIYNYYSSSTGYFQYTSVRILGNQSPFGVVQLTANNFKNDTIIAL